MPSHALSEFAWQLVQQHGTPRVLDVEHSIQAYKPSLTGALSHASYYIRPPEGMSVNSLIEEFEHVPGFDKMNLTLTSILGLDTYHQPLISVDDFAKKYFSDNLFRLVRVSGMSDPAIDAMAAFVEALKRPFSAEAFPHHGEFLVSGHRESSPGRPAEVKLLFAPGESPRLMKAEREVKLHLEELNLGRDIMVTRHITREQPPELILLSISEDPKGSEFLEELASSLGRATSEDVAKARLAAERTATPTEVAPRPMFGARPEITRTLPSEELRKRSIQSLYSILKDSGFRGLEMRVVQNGFGLEVTFPRSAKTLFLGSSFDEKKHIAAVTAACVGVRADPSLREGWDLQYRFDGKAGKLLLWAVDAGSKPLNDAKVVPFKEW
jgi:hypothetical protein